MTRAAGIHSLLGLMRIWPVAIDLACLPPLFLLMRRLYVSWRARWLAAFFFSVGNWVGQDYFSPQSFNYLLYLVFVAILVNWFTGPTRRLSAGRLRGAVARPTRLRAAPSPGSGLPCPPRRASDGSSSPCWSPCSRSRP